MIILRVTGLNDPTTPFVTLAARCSECGADLGQREYDVRMVDWTAVDANAVADGARAGAHSCGERN